ncbi:hypothetical protein FH972_014187 [Carpinus fangiana]|uniref:Uncharacterized protein n=1 Tax=Carpinus fangiana TaxID=176857 RepID=A0A5N6RCH2_9ROSI|nr:hypothetical protein FH972_014187 [Carpinus fangiana]
MANRPSSFMSNYLISSVPVPGGGLTFSIERRFQTSSCGSRIGFALCFVVTLCSTASEREHQIRRCPISRSML